MSMLRQDSLAVAAGATVRDVLFTTQQDPYTADRNEFVDVFLTQVPGAAGNLVTSIKAGPVTFADRILPTITTGRVPTTPIVTQDPSIRVGLRRGERLKIEATNLDGANPGTLNFLIVSNPA